MRFQHVYRLYLQINTPCGHKGEWGILNLQIRETELVSFKRRSLDFWEKNFCYALEINILTCWVMIPCSLVGGCQCLGGHLRE
jgi:hypothetical protein